MGYSSDIPLLDLACCQEQERDVSIFQCTPTPVNNNLKKKTDSVISCKGVQKVYSLVKSF